LFSFEFGSLFSNFLFGFSESEQIGSARPFKERSTDCLDLLSAADIAAGPVGQHFTSRDMVGASNARIATTLSGMVRCTRDLGPTPSCHDTHSHWQGPCVASPQAFLHNQDPKQTSSVHLQRDGSLAVRRTQAMSTDGWMR
jgi:hypothetical protein